MEIRGYTESTSTKESQPNSLIVCKNGAANLVTSEWTLSNFIINTISRIADSRNNKVCLINKWHIDNWDNWFLY